VVVNYGEVEFRIGFSISQKVEPVKVYKPVWKKLKFSILGKFIYQSTRLDESSQNPQLFSSKTQK